MSDVLEGFLSIKKAENRTEEFATFCTKVLLVHKSQTRYKPRYDKILEILDEMTQPRKTKEFVALYGWALKEYIKINQQQQEMWQDVRRHYWPSTMPSDVLKTVSQIHPDNYRHYNNLTLSFKIEYNAYDTRILALPPNRYTEKGAALIQDAMEELAPRGSWNLRTGENICDILMDPVVSLNDNLLPLLRAYTALCRDLVLDETSYYRSTSDGPLCFREAATVKEKAREILELLHTKFYNTLHTIINRNEEFMKVFGGISALQTFVRHTYIRHSVEEFGDDLQAEYNRRWWKYSLACNIL